MNPLIITNCTRDYISRITQMCHSVKCDTRACLRSYVGSQTEENVMIEIDSKKSDFEFPQISTILKVIFQF